MQLEELQQQWQRLDEKLELTVKMNGELLRLAVMQPARRRLNRLALWPALDTAFCVVVLLFAGSFLGKHWNTWSLVGPASVMMIAAILLLNASIRQLILLSEIDWSGTVVDIQSSLSRLRMAKISQFKWIILLSPLVGFCMMTVGGKLMFGVNVIQDVRPWWVVANIAFGLLFVPGGVVIVARATLATPPILAEPTG